MKILNDYLFKDYSKIFFRCFLFFVPLKLSLSYLFLIPLLIAFFTSKAAAVKEIIQIDILKYWICLLISFLLISFLSIDPLNSLSEVIKLALYSSSMILFIYLFHELSIKEFRFLLYGAIIACSHSILEFLWPNSFSELFVGTLSESGQLAMIFFISLALYFNSDSSSKQRYIYIISTILILLALLFNMKRGPLAAVFIASIILVFSKKPKLLIYLFLTSLALFIIFPTFQERLLSSSAHFFIHGGRYDLWLIASDLISKFPIGIGYGNSSYLQDYSSIIPSNLTHFHNNYINIFVEGGLLSLVFFTMFVFKVIKAGLINKEEDLLDNFQLLLFSLAIIAWCFAGLVEYSFGDSEVMLLAYTIFAYVLSKKYYHSKGPEVS